MRTNSFVGGVFPDPLCKVEKAEQASDAHDEYGQLRTLPITRWRIRLVHEDSELARANISCVVVTRDTSHAPRSAVQVALLGAL